MTDLENHISNFDKISLQRWEMFLRKNFPAGFAAELADPGKIGDGIRGPFTKVSSSKFARVFKCSVEFAGHAHNLYLKFYLYRSAWDFIKHIVRPSRAKRAFNAAIMLAKNGLYSPQIVSIGQWNYGPICTKSFMITRELENTKGIIELCKSFSEKKNALADKRRFIRTLGQTIGQMHATGIFHGDLRTGNVFAGKINGNWRFFFLDNERTMKFSALPKRLRLKNLVQINMLRDEVDLTDRLRFLKSYLQHNPCLQAEYKSFARKITHKTRHRLKDKLSTR